MKLRTYLASLVIAISTLPPETGTGGKRKPAPAGGDERRSDPLPYGIPSGQRIG